MVLVLDVRGNVSFNRFTTGVTRGPSLVPRLCCTLHRREIEPVISTVCAYAVIWHHPAAFQGRGVADLQLGFFLTHFSLESKKRVSTGTMGHQAINLSFIADISPRLLVTNSVNSLEKLLACSRRIELPSR